MASIEKLLEKLNSRPTPRNFPWDDLVTLLRKLGYRELSGGGSRRKFIHQETQHTISLHEPHPGRDLKAYQVRLVIESLKEVGLAK
jgi:hypothetical protein